MVVCQFFLQGRCRFGNNCRNEHPVQARTGPSAFGRASTAFSGSASAFGGAKSAMQEPEVALSKDGIMTDLGANGRPIWRLTCYAPARFEPNLIQGIDVSPEEDRLLAYQAKQTAQDMAYVRVNTCTHALTHSHLADATHTSAIHERRRYVPDHGQRSQRCSSGSAIQSLTV